MKNTFGQSLSVTLFGESHGPYIGAVLDGLAPGMDIDEDFIKHQLLLRRPSGRMSTSRVEQDEYILASGVFNGKTTGTPLSILIPNTVQRSSDYENRPRIARPGHADYTASVKYHGYEDFRGGGHFSGRITAAIVAAGAIVIPALRKKNIMIGTHIKSCGGIKDRDFIDYQDDIKKLSDTDFPVLDDKKALEIRQMMESVAKEGDSVGGVLETVVTGMCAGVGEPWFETVEGRLSYAMYSIPAIKGVQFGDAFDMVDKKGSEYNDSFCISGDHVETRTNHNGGINGGITNGMPIIFRCAVKPTPSIYKEQDSIDLKTKDEVKLKIEGRHDPAIIHRARIVVDSMTALTLYDMLAQRYGTDFFFGE